MTFGQFPTTTDTIQPLAIQLRGHFKGSFRSLRERLYGPSLVTKYLLPRIGFLLAGIFAVNRALEASVRVLWVQVSKPEYRPKASSTTRC